ncbi:MAG: NUDIX hydrolase [Clostridia bacterium]|nr:NUDIX hydrolase [Clostridia bacterium]
MRKEKLEELERIMEQYKTIEIKNLHQEANGYIKIEEADYVLGNNKIISRDRYTKGGNDASCSIILPVLENGDVILVVQPRVHTKNTVTVEAPAGMMDKGEVAEEAAKRELEEETGCIAEQIIKIASGYGDPGSSSGITNLFIAKKAKVVKEQHLDEDEYLSLFTCTYEEALELIDMGYICDISTMFILEKAKEYMIK